MSPAEMKEAYQRCKLGQAAAEQLSQPPERTEQGTACNLRRYMTHHGSGHVSASFLTLLPTRALGPPAQVHPPRQRLIIGWVG